jgi:uncharacterized protein
MQEKIYIKNSKGLRLASIIHYSSVNKKSPAVILLHGFTGYKDEEHLIGLAEDLEKVGLIALRFDCSGYGESEGTTADDYRLSNYLTDIESVYAYLSFEPHVDLKRIGIWGHSMGGLAGIEYAAKHVDVKALSVVSPPTKIDNSEWLGPLISDWKRTGWFERDSSRYGRIKIPYAFIEDSEKYNGEISVKTIHCPVQVILGENDDTVSPADTRLIFNSANEPKSLVEIAGMGHDYKKEVDLINRVNKDVLEFFASNL